MKSQVTVILGDFFLLSLTKFARKKLICSGNRMFAICTMVVGASVTPDPAGLSDSAVV